MFDIIMLIIKHYYLWHSLSRKYYFLAWSWLCQQIPRLSQRDRTEGWVSFGQKWKTV